MRCLVDVGIRYCMCEVCQPPPQAPLLEALDKETPPLSAAAPVADAHLGQYRAPLERVAIAKMLHQLSQARSRPALCAIESTCVVRGTYF